MGKGICLAGNLIVDITYPVECWPKEGELTTITDGITRSVGGLVCNVIMDLAKMDPDLPLSALGVIGNDAEGDLILDELGGMKNIDLSGLKRDGTTSFTAVMSNNASKARTFFQYRGANSRFDENCIDWDTLDADIIHAGYILLLDALDETDEEYGTRMAGLLARAQQKGIRTSIDVVSESGDRFRTLVPPAMKYTDYCVINEIEAQQVTGVELRGGDGTLYIENMKTALEKMKEMGVSTWAVIHCPEGGYGLDECGSYVTLESLKLPEGYIKGTVGAGDAFCAGVLYAAEKGRNLYEGIKLGTCAAAASLSAAGATEGMRPEADVLSLYDKYGA